MINKFKFTEFGLEAKLKSKDIAIDIEDAKRKYSSLIINDLAARFFDKPFAYEEKLPNSNIFRNYTLLAIGISRADICRYIDLRNLPTTKIIIKLEKLFEREELDFYIDPDDSYYEAFQKEIV
jgi:hypothetical protein